MFAANRRQAITEISPQSRSNAGNQAKGEKPNGRSEQRYKPDADHHPRHAGYQ
jgi:hypothetical protein